MRVKKERSAPKRIEVKLPKGYKIVKSDSYGKSFFFEKPGDSIEGRVLAIKKVKYDGKHRRVMSIQTKKGVFDVWDSATLLDLFDQAKPGKSSVFIYFEGLRPSKKKSHQPMKIFTTAIAP